MRVARRVREAARRNGSIERRDRASGRLHRPEPLAPPPPPPSTEFGRFPSGDKLPAWLRHPSLTGLEAPAFDALVARYRGHVAENPPVLLPGKRPNGGPGAAPGDSPPQTTSSSSSLRNAGPWPRPPLAEATGLSKNRIGATLRDTTPVLAALGYTVSPAPLTLTSTAQLEALVGRTPPPSPDQ